MTWERVDRKQFPLTYGETEDGTVWIALQSLVDFMGHIAKHYDQRATERGIEDADEVVIAGLCGASALAADLHDSFTLFGMDCDLDREPVVVRKRRRTS